MRSYKAAVARIAIGYQIVLSDDSTFPSIWAESWALTSAGAEARAKRMLRRLARRERRIHDRRVIHDYELTDGGEA